MLRYAANANPSSLWVLKCNATKGTSGGFNNSPGKDGIEIKLLDELDLLECKQNPGGNAHWRT